MGERRVEVRKFAQLPILMFAYHAPKIGTPDHTALEVLQTVLFAGESSRMYQRLVDKGQMAINVGGGVTSGFDPGLFTINIQPRAKVDTKDIEKAVYEELDKVAGAAVSDHDLQRAKNILLARFYRSLQTISGRANLLGSAEVFRGDYHKLYTQPEEYNRVTAADLQRVAKKYFSSKNRTVATLIPEGGAQ